MVCPKNIISGWDDEIEVHTENVVCYSSIKKVELPISNTTFVVTNYEQIRINTKEFLKYDWDFIILDESHRIKNRKAKTTKALWKLNHIKYKAILSGTPITKDEIDLWSQFKFLKPSLWGNNFNDFAKQALTKVDYGDYFILKPSKKRIKKFIDKASAITVQVKLEDIAEIPPMSEIPVKLNMSKEQEKHYKALSEGFMTEYEGYRATHALSVTGMIRLQQLTGGHLVLENNDVVRLREQPKLMWLIDKLEDIGKEKMFIVCKYTLEIEMIAAALKKLKYNYVIMKGGMKESEIKAVRNSFKYDKKVQILIGQVQVVKEGNNFQDMCRYGVFYSKSWSYVDYEQCKRRLYRNGQKRKVLFYSLILRNTIDEHGETLIRYKYINAENVLLKLLIKQQKEKVMADVKAKVAKKETTTKVKAAPEKAAKKLPGGERPKYGIDALMKEMKCDARMARLKLRAASVTKDGKYYDFKNEAGVKAIAKKLSKD